MTCSGKGGVIHVDSILEALGTIGRYQILQAALVCVSNLTVSFHLFSFVFTAEPVDHRCATKDSFENGTLVVYKNNTVPEKCGLVEQNATDPAESHLTCTAWTYTTEKQHSIVSEWDLVCEDEVFARLPQSLFIVGQAIGAVIFSAVSDRLGRKPALVIAHFLTGCAGLSLSFSPNIAVFTLLRMINGICQQGVVVTSVTLLLEMFPMRRRVEIASTYYFVWSLSTMTLSLTAYLLRGLTWRNQQLGFASVSLTVLLQLIFLRESLRWLITNRKDERAMLIIQRAAKMNNVDVSTVPFKCDQSAVENEDTSTVHLKCGQSADENGDTSTVNIKCDQSADENGDTSTVNIKCDQSADENGHTSTVNIKCDQSAVENKDKHAVTTNVQAQATSDAAHAAQYRYFDLFRSSFLLKMSAVVWFSWLVDSLTYFSLYLTTSSLADDLYLNFFLNSLAEIPSGPLYWFIGRRCGRRRHFMTFHTLAGVCLLLATGVRALTAGEISSTSATVLSIIGKVGNTACFNAMFIYAPEIYPTNLRTAGIGAGSTAARVGGSMAPFITMLAALVPWAPGIIFGIACLVAAGSNYHLPESEGRELPQTIEDIEAWDKMISRD